MMKRRLAAFALATLFAVVAPVTAFAGGGRSNYRPESYEHHYPYHSYHYSYYQHGYPYYWFYWPHYQNWDYSHWDHHHPWWESSDFRK